MKLLIAEDSMSMRVMLQVLTDQWGFETVLAEDGHQAWGLLSGDDAPGLVLLDWQMPGLNGLEVCRRVRAEQTEDPPYIILLTGRNETTDIISGLEAGANDYITKPFDNGELKARLQVGRRMLEIQRQLIDAKQALAFQASHDALTGLLNRGAIMQSLEQEMARARRQSQPLHVGLLDIDHFKQVNDTHGHLTGDAVLREVAGRLQVTLRPYDRVGRYGGEEFLVLLNGEAEHPEGLFERLRHAMADEPFVHEQLSLPITISCGVVTYIPQRDGRDGDALLAAADAALYGAKETGRNRTVFAQPD